MTTSFVRAFRSSDADSEGPIRFIASTEGLARDGLIIDSAAWDLENYRKNPVVLWVHDYRGNTLPIGRAEVSIADGRLICDIDFDADDPFAAQVERKYRRGYLHAVSVGWDTHELDRSGDSPVVRRAELLDISAVPVPGDADALIQRQAAAVRSLADSDELTPTDLVAITEALDILSTVLARATPNLDPAATDPDADPDVDPGTRAASSLLDTLDQIIANHHTEGN